VEIVPVEASSSAIRVAAVLTQLASRDHEPTLTEIAVATDMNKTTCQSVLLALTDTGYVQRDDARKTYRLGPAVLALTTAIGAPQEALARARLAMEAISVDCDVETTATVATDRAIVKVAQVPRPRLQGVALRPGQAVALACPLGAAHVAWRAPEVITEWLERAGITPRSASGRRALADLALVRDRGFSATSRDALRTGAATTPRGAEWPHGQVDDIGRGARRVRQLSAPVFGPDGRVLLVIGVLEHDEADAATIRRHVDRLLDAAHLTTAAIGGLAPQHAGERRETTR
jgi:DNA-binding IclR family transcriptional regulator